MCNVKYVLNCIVKIVVGEKELFLSNNIKISDYAVKNVIKNISSILITKLSINKKVFIKN